VWDLCGSSDRGQPPRRVGHGTCARSADAGGGAGAAENGDGEGVAGGGAGAAERDEGEGTGGGGDGVADGGRCSFGSFGAPCSVRTRSGAWVGAGATTSCDRSGFAGAVQRATTNDTLKTTTTRQTTVVAQRITDGFRPTRGSFRNAPHDPRKDRAVATS